MIPPDQPPVKCFSAWIQLTRTTLQVRPPTRQIPGGALCFSIVQMNGPAAVYPVVFALSVLFYGGFGVLGAKLSR